MGRRGRARRRSGGERGYPPCSLECTALVSPVARQTAVVGQIRGGDKEAALGRKGRPSVSLKAVAVSCATQSRTHRRRWVRAAPLRFTSREYRQRGAARQHQIPSSHLALNRDRRKPTQVAVLSDVSVRFRRLATMGPFDARGSGSSFLAAAEGVKSRRCCAWRSHAFGRRLRSCIARADG